MSHPFHSSACGCAADSLVPAQVQTLYPFIDHPNIRCFNECQPNQSKLIIRPYEQRHLPLTLSSHHDDAELLLHLPFTTTVKVTSLTLITSGPHAPNQLHLYTNRDDLDLSTVHDSPPTQSLPLTDGEVDYPVKVNKFQQVSSLQLYFPSNWHEESPEVETVIGWVHVKGQASGDRREVVNVVYEAVARPADHKAPDQNAVSRSIQ
jgi:hypothetical protein